LYAQTLGVSGRVRICRPESYIGNEKSNAASPQL